MRKVYIVVTYEDDIRNPDDVVSSIASVGMSGMSNQEDGKIRIEVSCGESKATRTAFPDDQIMCESDDGRVATWLMGEQTSNSLSWPFLCDECKQREESAIANGTSEWPSDFVITWDFIG